jgi:glucokinase
MNLGVGLRLGRPDFVVAVDLGGTWVRVALSDGAGAFKAKVQERIDARSAEAVDSQLVRLVRFVCRDGSVNVRRLVGVGIASTGPLDLKKGKLVTPANLPLDSVPITDPVGEALGVPVYLVNDCTAAVLGERRFGAGQGIDNLVHVTIGTGIGGGAIVDGHLLLGKDGNAVEIGHFVIDYEGRLTCGCGKKGHWEAYCSGRNMPNFVRMRLAAISEEIVKESLLRSELEDVSSDLSSQDLFCAAKRGDQLALQFVEEIGVLNAAGFANIVNAYDPSLITIGGSVIQENKELILPPIKAHIAEYALNREPRIALTALGKETGLYGALATVLMFNLME